MYVLNVILLLSFGAVCYSFKSPLKFNSKVTQTYPNTIANTNSIVKVISTAIATTPFVANADGGGASAVAIPIALSLLTLVPVIYYQQALKPKKRTVQQIPLDENLREIKTKDKKKGLW